MRSALNAFFGDMPAGQELRGLPLALMVSSILWDDEACTVISERWARFCRDAGALSDLLLALSFSTYILLFTGDLSSAASLVEEVRAATDATGINFEPTGAMALAAFRGNEAEASPFIEANVSQALHRREGNRLAVATWASAVLNNGLGRYQDALAAAQQATDPLDVIYPNWAFAELIEAAVRSGTRGSHRCYRRLAEMAGHGQRVGTGPAGAVAGAAGRWRREAEEFYESVDRAPGPYPDAGRTRPRPPRIWRMAAPPAPSWRRPGSVAHSPRHARGDGDGRLSERARRELGRPVRQEHERAASAARAPADGPGGPGRQARP